MHPITDEILALLDDDKRLLVLEDSDKQQLISMIEKKIAEWLDNNPTALFQALYILDIDEEKIRQVIDSRIDMAKKLPFLYSNDNWKNIFLDANIQLNLHRMIRWHGRYLII